MTLGKMLSTARERKGWSLRELSSRTGVSYSLICRLEGGKFHDASFKKIVRLGKALEIPISRLAEAE